MNENSNESPQTSFDFNKPATAQTLGELLRDFSVKWPKNGEASMVKVCGISIDSNEIRPGWLFVAVPGSHSHGAKYAHVAEKAGAVAILTDAEGAKIASTTLPVFIIEHPRKNVGSIAAKLYRDSLQAIEKKVALTGTNGKTTTSYFVQAALKTKYEQVGLIGTVEVDTGSRQENSFCTTPEAPVVYRYLAEMSANGVRAAVIEASSHALSYGRVSGLTFDVGIFTNLQHDHLDYYGSMDNYFAAKAELLTPKHSRRGVVCIDDEWGLKLAEIAGIPIDTVAVLTGNRPPTGNGGSHWFVTEIEAHLDTGGVTFTLHSPDGKAYPAASPVPGVVNAQNAALAIVAATKLGIPMEEAIASVKNCMPVPGRAVWVESDSTCQPKCMIDYAHTSESVARILDTIRPYTEGRIFHVFGTDGDRDASKREELAQNAARLADVLWVTDENPRWEDAQEIRNYLLRGIKKVRPNLEDVYEIKTCRRDAIREAIQAAGVGDVVLITGKGAETYQEIKGVFHKYNDTDVASEVIQQSLKLHREKLEAAK